MLKINQWSTIAVLFSGAASESFTINAKLTVPSGTFFQFNSGEIGVSELACVYLFGMIPPSSNAVVISVNPGFAGGGAGADFCASIALPDNENMITPSSDNRLPIRYDLRMIYCPLRLPKHLIPRSRELEW
jgi:hypothetical protein